MIARALVIVSLLALSGCMSVSGFERAVDAWKAVPGIDDSAKVNFLQNLFEGGDGVPVTGSPENDLEPKPVPCPKCKIMALCAEYHPGYPDAYENCVQRRTSQ